MKSQFWGFQLLNNKNREFENFESLKPRVCEGLLYLFFRVFRTKVKVIIVVSSRLDLCIFVEDFIIEVGDNTD